jgi:hypothetical protein
VFVDTTEAAMKARRRRSSGTLGATSGFFLLAVGNGASY